MKQIEEMKHLGYIGNAKQRKTEFDEDTYASELTLSEKNNKNRKETNEKITKKDTGTLNDMATGWIIGVLATFAFFISSESGKENIKRIITDCERPSPIPFGSIVINPNEGTKYGSKASVVCSMGYTSSNSESTCQANGKWSSVYCHVTDCGTTLPKISNGHVKINEEQDTTYGAMATITCSPGYQLNKNKISCKADGMWEEAVCQPVDCGIPEIANGHLEVDETVFLSQAAVKCDPGFAPSQKTTMCTATRVWQNAHCYNVDDCSPNPCQNEGKCVDQIGGFSCQCKQWYSGKTCDIGPCTNHRCMNGGTCIAQPGGNYSCGCPAHIDGNFCESKHAGFS